MATYAISDTRVTIEGKNRRIRATLTASGTYTTGGDDLPAFSSWGFKRNIDYVIIIDAVNADGIVYKYDRANHEILAYWDKATAANSALGEVTNGTSLAGKVLVVEAVGW